jgi:phosphate starvation-inducible PhoH-like protein
LADATARSTQVKILVPGHQPMVALLGQRDELLRLVESAFDTQIIVRGNEITITGDETETEKVTFLFEELLTIIGHGQPLTTESVGKTIDMVKTEQVRPSEVFGDVLLTTRGRSIAPKTLGQKRYVDAIRRSTMTFSIGPAGTGKTYLAVATAVRSLQDRDVSRIILTRPAVEAGERLGFLPGTLYEKIDPYLKPLYDALYEMMDAEAFQRLMERGTIEVAPLAYMRGRAQPYSSRVLTPTGFRPLGTLDVGDLVIGSDGRPTPVLGVYPQGRKRVFRVSTQDGASTVCCAEHLWAVHTASDRRRGRAGRVLETRQMLGRLRAPHADRFELPVLRGPAQFAPREVPVDPYALGLLLGRGCLTGVTTSTTAAADPDLVLALQAAIDETEVRSAGGVDHVPHRATGGRGVGVMVANPVTAGLREPVPRAASSSAAFVPQAYLLNSWEVRLGLLQGLLDAGGGPVSRKDGACGIHYSTISPRLRDDVLFLVRSLGGVVDWRTGFASVRRQGRAPGRDVLHRSGAFVMDIRLPAWIAPFRLPRKADRYASSRVVRPMRFIDAIEPAGEEATICISVAAPDSLYVTDDFIVTHNTLNDSFIILDEAQNTTPEQMKMFLTRLGFGSKAVVNGDVTQTDLPTGTRSGLVVVEEILKGIDGLEFVHLGARDVVRHRIVQDIVEAYRAYGERGAQAR